MASDALAPMISWFQRPRNAAIARVASWVLVGAVALLLPAMGVGISSQRYLILVALFALLISGLNITFGWAGELNLGLPAMYAAGAYAAAYLYLHVVNDVVVGIFAGVVAAVIVGVIAGAPGLRLGGWSLAVASFYLVLLIGPILQIVPTDILGGYSGLFGIPPARIFGTELSREGFYVVVIGVAILWFGLYRNLVRSRFGTSLLVLQHDGTLAPSLGYSRYRLKLTAYAIGAIPAGIAGALFAQLDLFLGPDTFTLDLMIQMLAGAIIAGTRSIYAVVIGAAAIEFFILQSAALAQYGEVAFGAFLIIGGLAFSGGIALLLQRVGRLLRARMTRDHAVATAAPGDPPIAAATLPQLPGQELRLEAVGKVFGGNQALDDVTLDAQPGQITALIGPNGSGKTTLLNLVNGFYTPSAGVISLGGRDATGASAAKMARLGVSRTFQTPEIPTSLSTLDVVASGRIALYPASLLGAVLRLPGYLRTVREDRKAAQDALGWLGIENWAETPASSLALGTRRMTELARVLVRQPTVILLDEVASGLDGPEITELVHVLRRVREAGATVVLVEHNFSLIRSLADRVWVLAEGRVIASGTPSEIERHPEVLRQFLGSGVGVSGTTLAADDLATEGTAK